MLLGDDSWLVMYYLLLIVKDVLITMIDIQQYWLMIGYWLWAYSMDWFDCGLVYRYISVLSLPQHPLKFRYNWILEPTIIVISWVTLITKYFFMLFYMFQVYLDGHKCCHMDQNIFCYISGHNIIVAIKWHFWVAVTHTSLIVFGEYV